MHPFYVRLLIALILLIIFLICGWVDSRARSRRAAERPVRDAEIEFHEAMRRLRSR